MHDISGGLTRKFIGNSYVANTNLSSKLNRGPLRKISGSNFGPPRYRFTH